jgi:hypothetical protein
MIPLLTFLTGLLIGFWAWMIYSKIRAIYLLVKDNLESPPGVVKLERHRPTRAQPINLESETGGIMRLTPEQVAVRNLKERERKVRTL